MSTTYHSNRPANLPHPEPSSSFWHSQPNSRLLNYRTTPELPIEADIVIVGTGITGASILRYLLTSKSSTTSHIESILVLEAREVCWGATGRNGGHCQPLLFDRDAEVASFELANMHAVKSYIEDNEIVDEVAWRVGTGCRTFWTEHAFSEAKTAIKKLNDTEPSLGKYVTVIEGSDKEELRKHGVRTDTGIVGVTLTEGAGQLWPYKYVCHVMENCMKDKRVNLQTWTSVTSIEETLSKDGRRTIHTNRGQVQAKHVVLATNGYTSHLLPKTFTDLIVPVRCQMSALLPPENSERLPDTYGMVGFEGGNVEMDDYLVQLPFYIDPSGSGRRCGGQLMFGGGRSEALYQCLGVSEDNVIDPGEAEYLMKNLPRMLQLGGDVDRELKINGDKLVASHLWTGIKGYSRDNRPWVGKVPTSDNGALQQGYWLSCGYTGHGMPNATLCGKAVAEMVLAEIMGKDHVGFCDSLVQNKEIPRSYLITKERLSSANTLPSVAEQEEAGNTSVKMIEERQGSRCCVM